MTDIAQQAALRRANLTGRDRQILDTLTLRVRVLSVEQIARAWFAAPSEPLRVAGRRIDTLARGGWLERFTMRARPALVLSQPILHWRPGEPTPSFGPISHQLACRWTAPVVAIDAVIASRSAGTWMGGYGGRRPRRSESSHDLTLAAIFLSWHARNPTQVESWHSEARLRHSGFGHHALLPDAMLDRNGQRTVIEMGGAYGAEKLAAFHRFCRGEGLPYELW